MFATRWFRVGACLTVVMAAASMTSGCTSPTYGTGTSAMAQLGDDLGQSVSLTPQEPKNKGVKYQPRPTLVMPAQASKETLVEPQQTVANKDNPQWVESPEETRARLVKEADENSDSSTYVSPLAKNGIEGGRQTTAAQTKAYREARALQKGAYIDQRRVISDPPTQYRQVDDPTKLDDLGEPELKKAKQRKKDAAVANSGSKWWNFLQ
jgi:hypothetical protein